VRVVHAWRANRQLRVLASCGRTADKGREASATRASACERPLADRRVGKHCRVPKRGRCCAPSHSTLLDDVPSCGARQAARGSPPCGAGSMRRMAKRTRQYSDTTISERPPS
jgi:hypothetical protein